MERQKLLELHRYSWKGIEGYLRNKGYVSQEEVISPSYLHPSAHSFDVYEEAYQRAGEDYKELSEIPVIHDALSYLESERLIVVPGEPSHTLTFRLEGLLVPEVRAENDNPEELLTGITQENVNNLIRCYSVPFHLAAVAEEHGRLQTAKFLNELYIISSTIVAQEILEGDVPEDFSYRLALRNRRMWKEYRKLLSEVKNNEELRVAVSEALSDREGFYPEERQLKEFTGSLVPFRERIEKYESLKNWIKSHRDFAEFLGDTSVIPQIDTLCRELARVYELKFERRNSQDEWEDIKPEWSELSS